MNSKPIIGILGWEITDKITLSQLESIPGNIAHPDTFSFPIKYARVKGTHYKNIVESPNTDALNEMIKASKQMQDEGIRAIISNCGFNAIFQKELSNSVFIPVISSSLVQIPLVHAFLKDDSKIGVITATKDYLTEKHFLNAGIDKSIPIVIVGLEDSDEFAKIRLNSNAVFDVKKFAEELLSIADNLVSGNNIGAIVFECTDLPPFSHFLREKFELPVFDIVSLTNMLYESLIGNNWKNII